MASPDAHAQELAIPFRVYGLEGHAKTQDDAISRLRDASSRHGEALGAQAVTVAKHDEQLNHAHDGLVEVKTDVAALAVSVAALAEKIGNATTRMAWTLTGVAFTFAGTTCVWILTHGT